MRHVIYVISCAFAVILAIAALITVDTRHTRQNELDNALALCCDETMRNTYDSLAYLTITQEAFLAEFNALLTDKISRGESAKDENLSLQVDVAGLDLTEGMFSVKVTEYFTYPNGNIGHVSSSRTTVYEEGAYGI